MSQLTGQSKARTTGELFWAVRRFFEALAARRPLVVVLEDIHWAEPTLLDLVEYLGAWASEAPILVLCLARPDLLDKRPGWKSTTETITLEPLSGTRPGPSSPSLPRRRSFRRDARSNRSSAEGNALFVEQLLAYVARMSERNALERPSHLRSRRYWPAAWTASTRRSGSSSNGRPWSGRTSRAARSSTYRRPRRWRAVDGRLVTLERRRLIQARRSRASADDEFRFHHVLIRDVAYAGITKEQRADLHERHGAWLEQRDEADELVGYHAEQAHRYRRELRPSDPELERLASWAGERLATAGIRAWKRADTPAAINLLGRAAALFRRRRPSVRKCCASSGSPRDGR